MLTKSFTLLFYLKKRNNYLKGELPIYMRLTVDGQRIEISTKGGEFGAIDHHNSEIRDISFRLKLTMRNN
jgi:hypothetical protein